MNEAEILRPDAATDHVIGESSAPVTVVEYGDFECPYCRQAHTAMKIMRRRFGRDVRFVYRHFPQTATHPHAELAAEASEAAAAQGRFWPYFDLLYEHQDHLNQKSLIDYARRLGLDVERFRFELDDHVYLQRVQEHLASGRALGIRGTPAFYVNDRYVDVSFGIKHLDEAIDGALGKASRTR